ncbi:MAG TPA: Asp-tRNA(Asn)/Glu-tRNA(Gln) amidotransferase GatCAB subunit B, partial [Pirellulales bacterium]|nr:Asp-tRNA(Asn)/Glu-tRNA(Gln) amidotransferase GatCAB subunit B [Pirellulales bacterium]
DLVPVTVADDEVEAVRANLGELPADLRRRLELTYNLTPYDSDVLVNQGRPLVDYYVELAELTGDGKLASNWLQQDVLRELKDRNLAIEQFPLRPAALAELLKSVKAGDVDTTRGREVLLAMLDGGKSAAQVMAEMGIEKVDETALYDLCRELVAANPKLVADVQAGKLQAAGAFVGQAKKKNPNVNPARVREICLELIAKLVG